MSKRTPPHPEYPSWTEARFRQFIRSALRAAWSRWPPKYEVLAAAKRTVSGKRHKYEFQCASCKQWFKQKEVQVDHITPVGSDTDWIQFIQRLFVGKNKLQVLCSECHNLKTKRERSK